MLNRASTETGFDVTPEAALESVRSFQGIALVDLDETLYLRNSTEDFIDSAQPGLVAVILMRLLDIFKPWLLTGGEPTRDVWRVRAVTFFLPWIHRRWRARVRDLAPKYVNKPLLEALQTPGVKPVIVSVGFLPIIKPLLGAFGLEGTRLVAATGFADRRRGKLIMAVEALGTEIVREALVITDSAQDLPLLERCAKPVRTVWPGATFRSALGRVYFPGEYLTRIKRPGERYIFRGILQEDFAFWVLSSVALAALPIVHIAGLALLLLSFWTIYERGYVDNDFIAAHYEHDPKLSRHYHEQLVATPTWQPWIWALAAGAAAVYLLCGPLQPKPSNYLAWACALAATYGWFKLYNRVDKDTRVWMFPFLQLARSAALVVLVPITAVGAAIIGAQVLARWVPYYVYRLGKKDWPKDHTHLIRVIFFVILAMMLIITQGPRAVFNWTGAAVFFWALYRARHEIRTAAQGISLLSRSARPR